MNAIIVLEFRFDRTPDGRVWAGTVFSQSFWTRYLNVFDEIAIVARVQDVPSVPPGALPADGPRISFRAIPYYRGPKGYLRNLRRVRSAIKQAFTPGDAVIMRVPSQLATDMARSLTRQGYPFGLEVVGDPYDVFGPGAVQHPLRPLFRWWFTRQLQAQCRSASAVSYVTAQALQSRYPVSPGIFSTHYSSIELPDEFFVSGPREYPPTKKSFTIITVGSLAQMYKGTDTLIEAVTTLVRQGYDLRLTVVGDGIHRAELEGLAEPLGERCHFTGQVPSGQAVRELLDVSDLFVLPSRTEGLPRAMIEAMARGLPCLGSNVGGIPELLPGENMVAPDDPQSLARKITELIDNPERLRESSVWGLETAWGYRAEVLGQRRSAFYRALAERTRLWMNRRQTVNRDRGSQS